MTATMSVIMAEVAAMALAAKMVSFASPPGNKLPHRFQETAGLSCNIFKIPRDSNATAHMLARQVTSDNGSASQSPVISCSRSDHVSMCPLRSALSSV
jgi:hypothetical protein